MNEQERIAWGVYCQETAGSMDVRDSWEQLPPNVQQIYLDKASMIQRAWDLYQKDGEKIQVDGKEFAKHWKDVPLSEQEYYLKHAQENPPHDIELTYFKVSGKYYTEGRVTVECPCYDIGKTVALMLAKGTWPGLTDASWHHFDVLIQTCPENMNLPADHRNFIVPIFLRNERIMEIAYS